MTERHVPPGRADGAWAVAHGEVRDLPADEGGSPERETVTRRPRLSVTGLSKTFASTQALSEVDLVVEPGEIHAVVGHNGSGKSTLVKTLSGYHKPDSGVIVVDGTTLSLPLRPAVLRDRGVSFVHQDLGLVDHLSVAENMRMTAFARRGFHINWRREIDAASATLKRLGSSVHPEAPVRSLGPSERAVVAIARALQAHKSGAGLMILDEATRSLPRGALISFYEMLRSLRAEGTSILMVSHKLDEVFAVADRVTVLRNGRSIATSIPTESISSLQLANLILGAEQQKTSQVKDRSRSAPCHAAGFSVTDLAGPGVSGFTVTVRPGEIVGLTGLPGSGFDDVPYLLAGARRAERGTCRLGGQSIELSSARISTMLSHGLALVPESRAKEGVAATLSVRENLTLPRLKTRGRWAFAGESWQDEEVSEAIRLLDIIPPDPGRLVGLLSGGNQQKVLLGKWLLSDPTVLILHEPAQGIDIGARSKLIDVLANVASGGTSMLIASAEPDDLAEICDRVLIMRDGSVVGELSGVFSSEDIVLSVYGSNSG